VISIQSEAAEMKIFSCNKGVKRGIKEILNRQGLIINNQREIKELIMGIKEDLAAFAVQVDEVTNTISTNVSIVSQKITDLQAQVASGGMTQEEVAAALDPVKAHLKTVSENLAAVAANGAPVVPPVEPL
jgi:hypothetical protein